ncbi:hypothetical protein NDN08_007635 [Rhodosorus marinus]|uniref:RING-type E3 ubiquitin transferase n=1 Tax=Rhodosorus marinus TaxID=101924 RepID=A0AAV8UZN1_9RHOD|nr:hypothetical protein NDN08_007635 [Rhodosorus marinus]
MDSLVRDSEGTDEPDECRICRSGPEMNRPLFFPCRCSGSIRFTHEDCLVQWLTQSGSSKCELCHYQFKFEREYRPGAPRKLSAGDMLVGLMGRLKHMVRSAARILLVLTVWIFLLPVGTCWTWHAVFLESPTEILPFVTSRGLLEVSIDAFYGCILSAGIVLVFFGVSSFCEYLGNLPDMGEVQPDHNHVEVRERVQYDEPRGAVLVDDDFAEDRDGPAGGYFADTGMPAQAEAETVAENDEPDFEDILEGDMDDAAFEPLEEVVGLRGPLRNLFDNAGTVLVSNAILLVVFALVPLLVGRLTQRVGYLSFGYPQLLNSTSTAQAISEPTTEGSEAPETVKVGNLATILVGYTVLGFLVCFSAIIATLLGNRYPRLNTPIVRHVMRFLQHVGTFLKVVLFILFEFAVFPLGCGWMLDACIVGFADSSFAEHVKFLHSFPWTSTAMHWVLGIIYMISVSLSVSVIHEVLRPELLRFIRNQDDPDPHPFREIVEKPLSCHARRMCFSVLIYVPMILLLVLVPMQVSEAVLPWMFPLRFRLTHPLLDIPADLLLLHVVFVPLAGNVRHSHPRSLLRSVLRVWMEWVGDLLGVKEHVLKNEHRDDDAHEPVAQDGPSSRQDATGDLCQFYRLRIGVVLFLTWIVLLVGTSLLIVLPTVLGRSIFSFLQIDCNHDIYVFASGLLILWCALEVALSLRFVLVSFAQHEAIRRFLSGLRAAVRVAIITVLWAGLLPLLSGLFIELTVLVHFRGDGYEFRGSTLLQDWAVGTLLEKALRAVVLSGERREVRWIECLEWIHTGNVARMDEEFSTIIRWTITPWLMLWIGLLVCPLLATQLGHLLFPASTEEILSRGNYAYIMCACVYLNVWMLSHIRHAVMRLHDSIRDDKYLAGIRLHNFVSGLESQNSALG